jgi:hypothetical protein
MSSKILEMHIKRLGVDAKFFRFEDHTMTVDAAVSRYDVGAVSSVGHKARARMDTP